MRLREVIDRLNSGTKTVDLAKELEVNEKRFRNGLKQAGLLYNNSVKVWTWNKDSGESLDKSIFDYVSKKRNTGANPKQQSNNKSVAKTPQSKARTSNVSSANDNKMSELQFTPEQVQALKEMANQYIHDKENETMRDRLHKKIMTLPEGKSARKTVVLLEEVGERLDNFAKAVRFHKSDILTLALMDFLDRYENEGE
ncbi:hypothetical protein [Bacillus rhizoplanae]|uniref:hypothetical protein n=1 Tax=Bacillus rhizoplanae TaxID=2880966 RepID=UPI003D210B7C